MASKRLLIAGGLISALIAVLHGVIALKPELYRWIAPSLASEIAQMAVEGSSLTTILTVVIAIIFLIWAMYALSGAQLIRRLPLLRPVLITIGVIYFLRALFLLSEIKMVMTEGYSIKFVFFSAISLLAGLLYVIGGILRRTPARSSNP